MNNLEPRAKIGDVVIVKIVDSVKIVDRMIQLKVVSGFYTATLNWEYQCEDDDTYREKTNLIFDKDILKNLTTNISYEQ